MKTTVTTVLDEICKVSDYPYFVSITDKQIEQALTAGIITSAIITAIILIFKLFMV